MSIYGPRFDPMEVHYFLEGVQNRPQGALGGGSPAGPEVYRAEPGGEWTPLTDTIGAAVIDPHKAIVSLSAGGGGYGDSLERSPGLVLEDVIEGWISIERAKAVYGVVLSGDPERWETLAVDDAATEKQRAALRESGEIGDGPRNPQEQLRWWASADIQGALPV